MAKKVIITVKGTQALDEQGSEDIELITEFHFSPAEVTITRKGTVTSKMVFIEGRQNLFLYETPFGSATLGVDTRKITNTLTEHGGELDIDYSLHFDRMMVSQNRFLVKIKEQAV